MAEAAAFMVRRAARPIGAAVVAGDFGEQQGTSRDENDHPDSASRGDQQSSRPHARMDVEIAACGIGVVVGGSGHDDVAEGARSVG